MREGTPPLSEALDAFLADVGIRRAKLTRSTYALRLRPLRDLAWPLTAQVCRQLVADQMQHYAPATVETFAGALKAFVKFCRAEGWMLDDPTVHLAYPKPTAKPVTILSQTHQDAILAACASDTDRTAVLLLRTGVRASEMLSMRVEDIDDGLILVRGKGSRYRYVPLPAGITLPKSGPLVPWSYPTLSYHLRQIGRRAKIPHLHAHLFRHTWASRGVEEHDLATVQIVGGWASDKMLKHYARSTIQKAAARKMAKLLSDEERGG